MIDLFCRDDEMYSLSECDMCPEKDTYYCKNKCLYGASDYAEQFSFEDNNSEEQKCQN